MADVGVPIESEITTESPELVQGNTEIFESPLKKQRKEESNTEKHKRMDRLENRLGGILCCAVCLDLPNSAVFQVIYFRCYTLSALNISLLHMLNSVAKSAWFPCSGSGLHTHIKIFMFFTSMIHVFNKPWFSILLLTYVVGYYQLERYSLKWW